MSEFWKRKIRTHFRTWDMDRDGYITEKDFADMGRRFAEAYNANDERKEELIEAFVRTWRLHMKAGDIEKDGRLTASILIESTKQSMYDPELIIGCSDIIRGMHRLMDVNHDGYLEPEEYQKMVRNMGVPEGTFDEKAAFEALDTDGDGKLSIGELVAGFFDFFFSQDESSPNKFIFGPLAD